MISIIIYLRYLIKPQKALLNGEVIDNIDELGYYQYNFPKLKDNSVSHIRPHGQNRNDVDVLPVRDRHTKLESIVKMCFWLNSKYISEVIKI